MAEKKFTATMPSGGYQPKSSITNLNVEAIVQSVSIILQSQIAEVPFRYLLLISAAFNSEKKEHGSDSRPEIRCLFLQ